MFQVYFHGAVAVQDLRCWQEIENFHSTPPSQVDFKVVKARQIEREFLHKGYYLGSNSPASKEQQLKVCM